MRSWAFIAGFGVAALALLSDAPAIATRSTGLISVWATAALLASA